MVNTRATNLFIWTAAVNFGLIESKRRLNVCCMLHTWVCLSLERYFQARRACFGTSSEYAYFALTLSLDIVVKQGQMLLDRSCCAVPGQKKKVVVHPDEEIQFNLSGRFVICFLELFSKELRWENSIALLIHFYVAWRQYIRKGINRRRHCGWMTDWWSISPPSGCR